MRRLRELAWRVVATLRRRSLEGETRAEMRFHLHMETHAGLARGLPRDEAERQARLRAGTMAAAVEAVRDQRGLGPFDGTLTDIRRAWTVAVWSGRSAPPDRHPAEVPFLPARPLARTGMAGIVQSANANVHDMHENELVLHMASSEMAL